VRGLLVAGTASGVGKTTVAMAIMAAMKKRGLVVQPFKGGPDFLDTSHHTQICGRSARNLDTWMLSNDENLNVMRHSTRGADVLVVEGMMGLFDGKDGNTEAGSSAEIAKLLKLPVVLVIDAAKSARSVAAVVLGFESFDPELQLAGVILNRVGSERHFQMLKTAIASACRTRLLGWLPRDPTIAIAERHLGLHAAEQNLLNGHDSVETRIDTLADLAERHLNIDALLQLRCGLPLDKTSPGSLTTTQPAIRIGVANDSAFSFYYEDNFDLLRHHGAEIIPFSPLHDKHLPENLDALYLGGGYPELYAKQLSCNQSMLDGVRAFAASDKPIYAECGGMLYLSEHLKTTSAEIYPMAGVLPHATEMTNSLVQFGYVTVAFTEDCLLGPQGTIIRGHSFHYSRIAAHGETATSYKVQYSMSGREEKEGFRRNNVLASYIHLHFRANPAVAEYFVANIRSAKAKQMAA
jgi:cobyrinic acid a,c-diamide synthase